MTNNFSRRVILAAGAGAVATSTKPSRRGRRTLLYAFLIVMGFIYLARGPISTVVGTVQGWMFGLVGV